MSGPFLDIKFVPYFITESCDVQTCVLDAHSLCRGGEAAPLARTRLLSRGWSTICSIPQPTGVHGGWQGVPFWWRWAFRYLAMSWKIYNDLATLLETLQSRSIDHLKLFDIWYVSKFVRKDGIPSHQRLESLQEHNHVHFSSNFSTFRSHRIKCRPLTFIPNFCCKYQSKKNAADLPPFFVDASSFQSEKSKITTN